MTHIPEQHEIQDSSSLSCEPPLVVRADAKLNLFLKVLEKRSDGYHEIETVMQRLDWHDTLAISPLEDRQVTLRIEKASHFPLCSQPIPVDERNLVIKAARLLQNTTGTDCGAEIILRKRIPAEAGLGGGSSDAAAVLCGLNELWSLGLSQQELMDLGAQIGSDIPFFLSQSSLGIASGRGEKIEPASGRILHFVVVKPEFGLSTAKVYANCSVSPFLQSSKDLLNALHDANLSYVDSCFKNELQVSAEQLSPEVREVLGVLRRQGHLAVMMSGSGSACFGLCRSHREAVRIAARLRNMNLGSVCIARSRV